MQIREAQAEDLGAINEVIRAAVMSWSLPDRVKRLSMNSHCYDELDLRHYHFLVAEQERHVVGVAAVDTDLHHLDQQSALILHGMYVLPQHHGEGIGTALFEAAENYIKESGVNGMLVRAQKDATGFFEHCGMHRLAITDEERDYANRYWKALTD